MNESVSWATALIAVSLFMSVAWAAPQKDESTGFIIDEGWELVRATCTVCHSSKLVIQNNLSEVAWQDTIRWMQEEQGLWDLGDSEAAILNYLTKNYGLSETEFKRKPLDY